MYVALDRPEILYSTKTVASFMQSPTKSAMVKLKRLVRYLVGFPQAEWAYSKQVVPKYLDVYGDSDWAGDEERKRSTTGVAEIFGGHFLDAVSVTQSLVALSGVLRLQPRHRGWTADVSFPDRGGLQGGSASVEALGDPTHVDTGAAAERGVPVEGCSYE